MCCGPAVAHCVSRVGVAGGDLDVPEIDASIEHRRDEGVLEHMRVGLPEDTHQEPWRNGAAVVGVTLKNSASANACSKNIALAPCRLSLSASTGVADHFLSATRHYRQSAFASVAPEEHR